MFTWIRRAMWLAILGGAGFGSYAMWQRSGNGHAPAAPQWPPLDQPDSSAGHNVARDGKPSWVAPNDDGSCPLSHPIKANASGIYHQPDGTFYGRTQAERCYATPQDAQADDYRPPKI